MDAETRHEEKKCGSRRVDPPRRLLAIVVASGEVERHGDSRIYLNRRSSHKYEKQMKECYSVQFISVGRKPVQE